MTKSEIGPSWGTYDAAVPVTSQRFDDISTGLKSSALTSLSVLEVLFPLQGVSLVPALVIAIPKMFLLLLHGRPSLLFPALFSARRIVRGSITPLGNHHVLTVELWLFSQLIFINDATFILTRALRVCPVLLLSRGKDSVEDDPWVMHHGCNNKDILPLQTSLWGDEWSQWISSPQQTHWSLMHHWGCKSTALLMASEKKQLQCV